MTVDWGTGHADFRGGKLWRFENNGVVWYDVEQGIALEGWQAELEPYEGQVEAWPLKMHSPHSQERQE